MKSLQAVYFDLDGTLIDTAPDFYSVLNHLLAQHGRPAVSYAAVRANVSNGARALTELGFGLGPEDAAFDDYLNQLLDAYAGHLAVGTRLFEGMADTLNWLDQQGLPWGIVTNKPERFTLPVLEGLGLATRVGAVICPDHVRQRKPDPEGLLMAAGRDGVNPAACLYVGDHLRDIQAGKNAGMATAVAAFGYIDADDDPRGWQADHLLEQGDDLLPLLKTLTSESLA
ncbi:Haloacid dehalogenase-like hydrolase, putative [Alloalcanivorax dieselolei B5]|uniref:Haloacid dehalogenase-like hydrolase, putative n=1 Tax=Alcanivorax dieselolei (strain DSM 16502 / CGMCC 1.3690 / MCCC 1A00001 / B-5) TaxID=930169 RepID=K0CI70_ALCDB|nr:HAD-IA family hydrolase [Alloalcanivorax dieselolei]AFT71251.1 Haloacid dehalogenase-like hydrolase, putative [Alloalcanivorax dieselolei B5]GGJ94264.1 phosphoglycolate phosphatase 2 [Alloalcanivorax dieselolei]